MTFRMPSQIPPITAEQQDSLTGLRHFAAGRDLLEEWLAMGQASVALGHGPAPLHAMLIGISRFETVNLAYGEAMGDAALAEVARRIREVAGSLIDGPWFAARAPGGSFLLVAHQACRREQWQAVAETLADVISEPIMRREGNLRLSPRLALLRLQSVESAEGALDRLAQALAAAQRDGARRVLWVDGETQHAGRTAAQLEADLLKAIDRGEIEVHFQPQYALEGDGAEHLSGAEALARWNHPMLGQVGAGPLFAIAERADFVAQLSRHIAEVALRAAALWPQPLRLSLNVTAADLAVGRYAEDLRQALDLSGFPAERLTLEVTEQVLLADMALAERSLAELAEMGVRLALDDFGAGFCNFHYLKILRLHYLKLDRSMVVGIAEDKRDLAILRAILAMAKALDLGVIAEGVEHESQRLAVAREGCGWYQGFVRAQPMDGEAFLELARGR